MSRGLRIVVVAALLNNLEALRKHRANSAEGEREVEEAIDEAANDATNEAIDEGTNEADNEATTSCEAPALSRPGETGTVDFVYTFGAPGTGSPALSFPAARDGCFPGHRVWMTAKAAIGSKWTDLVTGICNNIGFWHSKMNGEDITEDHPQENGFSRCDSSNSITSQPSVLKPSIRLHGGLVYMANTANGKICVKWNNFTAFARTETMKDANALAVVAPQYGWRMVGANWGSHLLQRPDTLECVLNFRGTDGHEEWLGNLQTRPTRFCGLTYENESCAFTPCRTSKPGGSFTHFGFTDRLRRITQDNQWQQNIRRHLPKCSKVYVAGHSAGGAMAELFQACVMNAPKPGEFGYDTDFQHISWVKERAGRLPYM